MKTWHALIFAAVSVLSSCGTAARYASSGNGQRFQDGIYGTGPSFMTKAEKTDMRTGTEELVAKTKASEIYLFGDRKDTVAIPQNMSATIRYDKESGGTSVTVAENIYDWRNNIDPWSMYTAWDFGWRYSYSPWGYPGYWGHHYGPWHSYSWHSPWYVYGWYDPWYSYGGWHDPWYGGWYGYYDPYYWGWHHPHYCGWYGGWGHRPGGGVVIVNDNRWHGRRSTTGSDRVFTSRVSARSGTGNSSRSGRSATVQSSRAGTSSSLASSARLSPVQSRNISRAAIGQPARQPAQGNAGSGNIVSRSGTQQQRPAQPSSGPATNYRRPAAQSSGSSQSTAGSRSGYSRPASSGYERSSTSSSSYQNYDRSGTSSYSRSSSSAGRSSSGFSSGTSSASRSSSYSGGSSGGGYSRSSGSSGGGRR